MWVEQLDTLHCSVMVSLQIHVFSLQSRHFFKIKLQVLRHLTFPGFNLYDNISFLFKKFSPTLLHYEIALQELGRMTESAE